MNIIFGRRRDLGGATWHALQLYRYQVFVEILGWQLDTAVGTEIDQFDHDDTVYIVMKNNSGDICGCARLLPTTGDYLLQQVFPALLQGADAPSAPDLWELSRFAAVDLQAVRSGKKHRLSSPEAVQLLQSSIEIARQYGASQLITVSPAGVERLIRHAGFRAGRAGDVMRIDGYSLVACLITTEGQQPSYHYPNYSNQMIA